MNAVFSLQKNIVHLWQAHIPTLARYEADFLPLLSFDEIKRARRFHFPLHQLRFIVARGLLRKVLNLYTDAPIEFEYGSQGKPFLKNNTVNLQFNVSHSEDWVVYALCSFTEIGVDIQKKDNHDHAALARRYFSEEEYATLMQFTEAERPRVFCAIWAAKEAIIKAVGAGLHLSLQSFTLTPKDVSQWVLLPDGKKYYLSYFFTHEEYQSAFATLQSVDCVKRWQFDSLDSYAPL